MLKKSRTGAFILSAITVLSFSLVTGLINILIPYLTTGDMQTVIADPTRLSKIEDFLQLGAILLGLLLVLTAIGAYWLYKFFGDGYFGGRGALRWALFGAFFALFIAVPDRFLPDNWQILGMILKFLGVFAAFFLSRLIVPVIRLAKNPAGKKQKTSTQKRRK